GVLADASDVARVLSSRLERSRDVAECHTRRRPEDLDRPGDADWPSELGVDAQRMAGEDRHPHTGSADLEVRDREDLAALVAQLLLFVGLERAIVDVLAGI